MNFVLRQARALATALALAGGCALVPPPVMAEFERGQALYENHCRFCHESWAHTRSRSRVTSISSLRQRVAAWSTHSGLGWGKEEIDDVTDYLNRHFYKLVSSP
jgi:cytochrome c